MARRRRPKPDPQQRDQRAQRPLVPSKPGEATPSTRRAVDIDTSIAPFDTGHMVQPEEPERRDEDVLQKPPRPAHPSDK